MIYYITGVPGSGKTYKAMFTIFNNFSDSSNAKKDIKKDYLNCYTNINEIKLSSLNNVYNFDKDKIYDKLLQVYTMYKNKSTDDELINECIKLEIYKTLFVIDECHNIFDKQDKVLIWWLSYHRHLYHDIVLITQNLPLVHSKYKGFSEFFYRAKPAVVSLNKNTLKYDVFINSRMALIHKSHSEKLPKIQEVFTLYGSGDVVESKNVLFKYYLFSFILLVFLISIIFYFFIFDNKSNNVSNNKSNNVSNNKSNNVIINHHRYDKTISKLSDKSDFYNDYEFINLDCSLSFCSNNIISLPIGLYTKYKRMNLIIEIYKNEISENYMQIYVRIPSDFYSKINKKGSKDENVNIISDNVSFFGSSK